MFTKQVLISKISRAKAGVARHVGLLLPDGRVVHCAPGRGEHISSVEEFSAGQDVNIDRVLSMAEHAETIQRIAAAMGAPQAYCPLTNNCEMFVNRMLGLKDESPQLQSAAVIVGLAAIIGWAAASR